MRRSSCLIEFAQRRRRYDPLPKDSTVRTVSNGELCKLKRQTFTYIRLVADGIKGGGQHPHGVEVSSSLRLASPASWV
jgi:hypothetical protein